MAGDRSGTFDGMEERLANLATKRLIVASTVATIGAITGLLVLLQHLGILL